MITNMMTNWSLIRSAMNAAIDACERIEVAGYDIHDRDATVVAGKQTVSVFDILVSFWTYPENLRYQIIRKRHGIGNDLSYVPESARILTAVAAACAELIKAGDMPQLENSVTQMAVWFNDNATAIEKAIAERRHSQDGDA